jgi:DNA integrity scanning protein DisA with diadenylate cyclase activity
VLAATLTLAVEIARDGHEGRRIGALFTIGRPDAILASSRALILDPLAGHAPRSTRVTDEALRGTVKQLAQLDGAFVLADDGSVLSACRYLDVSSEGVRLPMGLGSRHVASAAVSERFDVVAIAVSASGVVRVFCGGEVVATLHAGERTS